MTDELKKTYSQKIEELLNKVSKGEEVYKPIIQNPLHKKIKEKGVKTSIIEVFNEAETPRFTTEEISDEVEGTKYVKVSPESSYKDVDNYWHVVSPRLQKIGVVNQFNHKNGELDIKVDDIPIKITLVRDSENHDNPAILVNSSLPEDQIIKMVEKCGLKVDRLESKRIDKNHLILEIRL